MRVSAGVVALFAASLLRVGAPARVPPPSDAAVSSAVTGRVLSLDHPTAAATAAWIGVVGRYEEPVDGERPMGWLPGALAPIGDLDPRWRTPWTYAALMARAHGDLATHHDLLGAAIARHPAEPWFPYALGMSLLQDVGDRDGAAAWLRVAASLPGAPAVHGFAADALARPGEAP